MKRLVTSLAVCSIVGSLMASAVIAYSAVTVPSQENQINLLNPLGTIQPMAVIGPYSKSFTTEATEVFEYRGTVSGQRELVQIAIKNTGTREFNYWLISPSKTSWIQSSISPGKTAETPMWWDANQKGNWTIRFVIPGSGGSGSFQWQFRDNLGS